LVHLEGVVVGGDVVVVVGADDVVVVVGADVEGTCLLSRLSR